MHLFFECRSGICSPKVSVRVSDVDPPFLKSFGQKGGGTFCFNTFLNLHRTHRTLLHFFKIIEKVPSEEREKVSYVNFLHRTLIGHIGQFGEKEF